MPFRISPKLLKHFKNFCSSPEIIMLFVYMKCRFSLSYRDLEEMMSIRGACVDHATLQRWVMRFVPLIDKAVRARKKALSHLFSPPIQNREISNSGHYDAINIAKFSNVDALSLDPAICPF